MSTITTTRKGRFQLGKLIGTRYRFDLDEAWFHELAEEREPNRLWYERVPVKGGFIGVQNVKPLTFKLWIDRVKLARNIHEAIKDTPGFIRADFAFDGEAEICFTREALPTVAEMAGARKKRQLSPEQKADLAQRGVANRFKSPVDGAEDVKPARI